MASAVFYSFSKRKNSTKQPTGSGTSLDVNLKSGTSLLSPTFLLSLSSRPITNYVVFEGRNYFVRDIVSIRDNLWEIVCEIDALATIKSDILATKAYVIYDSVANIEIPDNRIPMKTSATVSAQSAACPFVPDGGCYILSLTGSNNTTGVYKVTENELAGLIDDAQTIWDDFFLNTPTPPSLPTSPTVEDCLTYLADYFKWFWDLITWPIVQLFGSGNIPENIRECRFIPFNVGTTGSPQQIYLGTWESLQTLGKLATDTVHRTTSVSIPWQTADYRRRSPFTELYIYLPYIGMVKLSSENLVMQSTIDVAYTLALRDGSLICTLTSGGEVIGQYSGNVGASVPVGISNINAPKAAQSLVSGIASAAMDNFGGVGMATINFANAITPNFSCIGGLDGLASTAANQNIVCYSVFHDTVVAPNSELATIGSPTMAPKALSSLTGYCQCLDAHVESSEMSSIVDIVDGYLNSGFFIE